MTTADVVKWIFTRVGQPAQGHTNALLAGNVAAYFLIKVMAVQAVMWQICLLSFDVISLPSSAIVTRKQKKKKKEEITPYVNAYVWKGMRGLRFFRFSYFDHERIIGCCDTAWKHIQWRQFPTFAGFCVKGKNGSILDLFFTRLIPLAHVLLSRPCHVMCSGVAWWLDKKK